MNERIDRREDEEKPEEEPPPFRWNWQAFFMVALTLFAMTVPVLGLVWFAGGYRISQSPPSAREGSIDTEALEKGLEKMADGEFSENVTLEKETKMSIPVAAEDAAPRSARIAELAREAGGSALEMNAPDAKGRRLIIQVPSSRRELLKRAIRGERVDFSAIPASAATEMLEINLLAP